MTREERRQRRRENILLVIYITIIAVWVACLLLSCEVYAAGETVEAVSESDTLTTALAVTGAVAWSWALTKVIVWLDTPQKRRRPQ